MGNAHWKTIRKDKVRRLLFIEYLEIQFYKTKYGLDLVNTY